MKKIILPSGRPRFKMTLPLSDGDYDFIFEWSQHRMMYIVQIERDGEVILSNKGLTLLTDLLATTRLHIGTLTLQPLGGITTPESIRAADPTIDNLGKTNELIYDNAI